MSSLVGKTGIGKSGSRTGYKDRVPEGYETGQLQQFTPEQMDLFKQMFSHLSPDSFLSKIAGGDQSAFAEMEAPALRQFNELQGGISSRFSGMGMGGRKSSGFQNTMNAASSNFAQDLQSRRVELQRQAIMDLMGLSNNLLNQRPYDRFMVEEQQSPWNSFMSGVGGAIPGAAVGFLTGGPAGAAVGGAGGFASGVSGGGGGSYSSMGGGRAGSNTSGPYGLPTFLGG